MEFLPTYPIKILAQGYTEEKVAFRDIDFDIPFVERIAAERKKPEFHIHQKEYNSAEIFNGKLREQCPSPLPAYELCELPDVYVTKAYKEHRFSEIVSASGYLVRIAVLTESICNKFLEIMMNARTAMHSEELKSGPQRKTAQVKTVLSGMLAMFRDLVLSISDMNTDSHGIGTAGIARRMKERIRLAVSVRRVPGELASDINALFPNARIAFARSSRGKGIPPEYADFKMIEKRLYQILAITIQDLLSQFSYYVTPDLFLNNPAGRTLFVIPFSMYAKFGFLSSGLFRSERASYSENSQEAMVMRYLEFIQPIKKSFAALHDEARFMLSEMRKLPDGFDMDDFVRLYLSKHPVEKMDKVKKFIAIPPVREKITEMLFEARGDMVRRAKEGKDPWYEEGSPCP